MCFFSRSVFISIFVLIGFSFTALSQSGTISGFVFDNVNGEALIGANAFITKLNIGASTNLSGYFVINNVPFGKREVTISFLGYRTQQVEVDLDDKSEIIKIYLEPDIIQLNQVIIKGDSIRTIDKLFEKPISKIELNSKQINNIPRFVEADLLRSLQTLPGIQPLSDFSSALYVRGGTPDQNLYMIDGTDVYNPEHAFGLFSTFNTNAIKKIELSKGGFGAEYGGRLSSILSVTNLDGNRNYFQSDITISLISGSITFQAPMGNLGSVSGSFRRTYIDETYAKFVKEIPDYYFYDGNFKAFFDIDEKNKLVVSFYGGQDKLDFKLDKNAENSIAFLYDWGNTTGSLNWKKIFSKELFANFWITASRFSSNFSLDEIDLLEQNVISDVAVKSNLEYYFSNNLMFKLGFEQKSLYGKIYQEFPGGLVDATKYRKHYSSFITSIWKPIDKLNIETGLRYDYFDSEKNYSSFDPRLAVKYRLNETTNLKFSTGIYHQYLNRISRLFFSSLWTSADEFTKGSTAFHIIGGFQKELAQIYELEIEAYFKDYKDLYSFNQNMLTEIKPTKYNEKNEPVFGNTFGLFNRGDASSFGLEVLLRKDYGAITGWLGYSFAVTENTIDALNQGKPFKPRHDRTHTVNLVTNVNIDDLIDELKNKTPQVESSKWLFSLNFVYSTGQPLTMPASVYSAGGIPDWTNNQNNVALFPSELNTVRLPPYIRMDFSLTWENYFKNWTLAPYLQIFNVGNRKNVWFIDYENKIKDGTVTQEISTVKMLPILPTIGVNIKF